MCIQVKVIYRGPTASGTEHVQENKHVQISIPMFLILVKLGRKMETSHSHIGNMEIKAIIACP